MKTDTDRIKSYLKILLTELADAEGDMYEDLLSAGMHYRVKMKIRRIIKEAHNLLNQTGNR